MKKKSTVRCAMYKMHKDHFNGKWMVFFEQGKLKEYIQSFNTQEEAKAFCDINNGVVLSMAGK